MVITNRKRQWRFGGMRLDSSMGFLPMAWQIFITCLFWLCIAAVLMVGVRAAVLFTYDAIDTEMTNRGDVVRGVLR